MAKPKSVGVIDVYKWRHHVRHLQLTEATAQTTIPARAALRLSL